MAGQEATDSIYSWLKGDRCGHAEEALWNAASDPKSHWDGTHLPSTCY